MSADDGSSPESMTGPGVRAVQMVLRGDRVTVSELQVADGILSLRLEARLDPESLTEIVASLRGTAAAHEPGAEREAGPEDETASTDKDALEAEPGPAAAEEAGGDDELALEGSHEEEADSLALDDAPVALADEQDEEAGEAEMAASPPVKKEAASAEMTGSGRAHTTVMGDGSGDRQTAVFMRKLLEQQAGGVQEDGGGDEDGDKAGEPELEEGPEGATASRYGEPAPDGEWAAAAGSGGETAEGGSQVEEPAAGPQPLPRSAASAEARKTTAHIRYVCPRCKTAGSQPADRVGAIVTCRRCGKAMRLTLKR